MIFQGTRAMQKLESVPECTPELRGRGNIPSANKLSEDCTQNFPLLPVGWTLLQRLQLQQRSGRTRLTKVHTGSPFYPIPQKITQSHFERNIFLSMCTHTHPRDRKEEHDNCFQNRTFLYKFVYKGLLYMST